MLLIHVIGPAVLFAVSDGVLLSGELQVHHGQWVGAGRPAHERVLPALPRVKLYAPLVCAVGARLHGVLGGGVDTNASGLKLFLRDPGDHRDIVLALYLDGLQLHVVTRQFDIPP